MKSQPIRILAVSHTWQGANDYAFVRAFRRAGHSVSLCSEASFIPNGWRHPALRALRRVLMPLLVADYQNSIVAQAESLKPEMFFVFKGTYVTKATIDAVRALGTVAINFYPDVGFDEHSPYIRSALPRYDWVFTTKSLRLDDMRRELDLHHASFLPHAYDPETHFAVPLDAKDLRRYGCEASFIGSWSPKKEALLRHVRNMMPNLHLKIWGNLWERAAPGLETAVQCQSAEGVEYAKAIRGSEICIAILIEPRVDSATGDVTTARTFEIPAVGSFMLHERTDEAQSFFSEGFECAMFGSAKELVAKIDYYRSHSAERKIIADAGHRRALSSNYSVDHRAATILERARVCSAQQEAS